MDEKINYRQQWFDGEIEAGTLLDTIDHLASEVERYKTMSDNYYILGVDKELKNAKLRADVEQLRNDSEIESNALEQRAFAQQPAQAVPDGDELDARLADAGMLTVANLMQGQPIDAFIKHAGVCDLDTFSEWLDMKCREFMSLKARRELEKQEDDELYEWVLCHAAAFHEVRVNFKAALTNPAARRR